MAIQHGQITPSLQQIRTDFKRSRQYDDLINKVFQQKFQLLVQLVPVVTLGVPPCYCHMAGCSSNHRGVTPGDFMLSLEQSYSKESELQRMAVLTTAEARHEPRGPDGRLGLGVSDQIFYCLECIESVFRLCAGSVDECFDCYGHKYRSSSLLRAADRILADERVCEDYEGCFSLTPAYRFGVELWKEHARVATIRLSRNAPDADYMLVDGTTIGSAIKPADVRGQELSAVLALVRNTIAEHSNGTVEVIKPPKVWESLVGHAPIPWKYLTMSDISCHLTRAVPSDSTRRRAGTQPGRPSQSRRARAAHTHNTTALPTVSAPVPCIIPAPTTAPRTTSTPLPVAADTTPRTTPTSSQLLRAVVPSRSPDPPQSSPPAFETTQERGLGLPTRTRALTTGLEAREVSVSVNAAKEARRREAAKEPGEEATGRERAKKRRKTGSAQRREFGKEKEKERVEEEEEQEEEWVGTGDARWTYRGPEIDEEEWEDEEEDERDRKRRENGLPPSWMT